MLGNGTVAGASVPAQAWLGAERVVLDCTVEGPLSADDREALCAGVLAQARDMASMPVRLAGDGVADEKDLLVAVTLSATEVKPQTMGMSIAVSRAGLAKVDGPRTKSVPVAISWTGGKAGLGGRALPLEMILGDATRERARPGIVISQR